MCYFGARRSTSCFRRRREKKRGPRRWKQNEKKKKRKIYRRAYRGDEVGFDTARRHRLEKPVAFPTWNLILVIHFPFHRRAPLMNMTAGWQRANISAGNLFSLARRQKPSGPPGQAFTSDSIKRWRPPTFRKFRKPLSKNEPVFSRPISLSFVLLLSTEFSLSRRLSCGEIFLFFTAKMLAELRVSREFIAC